MSQKIIIFGFPHSGTTILRSIISHIEDVEEILGEVDSINRKSVKKYVVCKYPFTLDKFFTSDYKNYIKIFITRNPLYVFSSLNKRFNYKIPNNHSIDEYFKTIDKFVYYKKNPKENLYTIKYEDMFVNNYEKLKNILDSIGFEYTDKIFDNSIYTNRFFRKNINDPNIKLRTIQINEEFKMKNDPSKIDLSDDQMKILTTNEKVQGLYQEIN
jgi:hypothetical protein